MSASALFGGLAQGIFGRTRELEDEQRKMDLESRQEALTGLGKLLEQATPETRPIIYNTMADVMKLKGKHRGVWDMLTGGGRDDYHRKLSATLGKVYGNVMGPKAYEAATTVAPTSGNQADWGDESAQLTYTPPVGKIALRDPQQEEIEALRQRYGIQNNQKMVEIELRNRLTGERERVNDEREAKLRKEVKEQEAAMAAFKPIMRQAQALSGSMVPTEEAIDQAAKEYAEKNGLDVEFLKSKIKLNIANEGLAGAKTDYYKAGGAGGAEKPITPYQQYGIDSAQRAQAAAIFEKWNKVNSARGKIDAEQTALRTQLQNIAKTNQIEYDEAGQKFVQKLPDGSYRDVDPDEILAPGFTGAKLAAAMAKMQILQKQKEDLFGEMGGYRQTLMGQFPGLYKSDNEYNIQVNPEYGGLAPAGAPRTGNPPPFPEGTVRPVPNVTQYKSSQPVPKGTILETGRGKFKVLGVKGKDKDGLIIHDIVPVTE